MNDIIVCPLSDAHLDGAYETEQECLAEGWSKEAIKSFIERDDAVYLVAVDNGV